MILEWGNTFRWKNTARKKGLSSTVASLPRGEEPVGWHPFCSGHSGGHRLLFCQGVHPRPFVFNGQWSGKRRRVCSQESFHRVWSGKVDSPPDCANGFLNLTINSIDDNCSVIITPGCDSSTVKGKVYIFGWLHLCLCLQRAVQRVHGVGQCRDVRGLRGGCPQTTRGHISRRSVVWLMQHWQRQSHPFVVQCGRFWQLNAWIESFFVGIPWSPVCDVVSCIRYTTDPVDFYAHFESALHADNSYPMDLVATVTRHLGVRAVQTALRSALSHFFVDVPASQEQ